MKSLEFAFEINWPLAILFFSILYSGYWIGTYIKNILNKFPIFSSPTTTKLLLGTLALLMTTRILTVHGRPSSRCVFTFLVKIAPLKSTAAHCGFKWVKYARNKFTWCDFTSYSKQFSADLHHFRFRFLCISHSKLVKLLQTQVWPLNLTSFLM